MSNDKIEALEERIRELEEKIQESNSPARDNSEKSSDNAKSISRREFLKKAGLGSLGLGALFSPVSADYFIKDDSFSVQTTNTGDASGLTEGLFVDQNQNVNIPNGNLDLNTNSLLNVNQINGQDADSLGGSVPSGIISMWSGAISDIPEGWTLCDGSNGSPDLRDKFVVGAGGSRNYQDEGGSESNSLNGSTDSAGSHDHGGSSGGHTLTVDEMPSHTHTYRKSYHDVHDVYGGGGTPHDADKSQETSSTGGNQSHDHNIFYDGSHSHSFSGVSVNTMPPYYALAYIMKL